MWKIKNIYGNDEIVEADGSIQEFEIAKSLGKVIIPIGSTGYAAMRIHSEIKNDISNYSYLEKYIDQLETETDIDQIVVIIMEIINNQLV